MTLAVNTFAADSLQLETGATKSDVHAKSNIDKQPSSGALQPVSTDDYRGEYFRNRTLTAETEIVKQVDNAMDALSGILDQMSKHSIERLGSSQPHAKIRTYFSDCSKAASRELIKYIADTNNPPDIRAEACESFSRDLLIGPPSKDENTRRQYVADLATLFVREKNEEVATALAYAVSYNAGRKLKPLIIEQAKIHPCEKARVALVRSAPEMIEGNLGTQILENIALTSNNPRAWSNALWILSKSSLDNAEKLVRQRFPKQLDEKFAEHICHVVSLDDRLTDLLRPFADREHPSILFGLAANEPNKYKFELLECALTKSDKELQLTGVRELLIKYFDEQLLSECINRIAEPSSDHKKLAKLVLDATVDKYTKGESLFCTQSAQLLQQTLDKFPDLDPSNKDLYSDLVASGVISGVLDLEFCSNVLSERQGSGTTRSQTELAQRRIAFIDSVGRESVPQAIKDSVAELLVKQLDAGTNNIQANALDLLEHSTHPNAHSWMKRLAEAALSVEPARAYLAMYESKLPNLNETLVTANANAASHLKSILEGDIDTETARRLYYDLLTDKCDFLDPQQLSAATAMLISHSDKDIVRYGMELVAKASPTVAAQALVKAGMLEGVGFSGIRGRADKVFNANFELLQKAASALSEMATLTELWEDSGLSSQQVERYAKAVSRCVNEPELGITHPLRFDPTTLYEILKNRDIPLAKDTRPVALIIAPLSDHNGSLNSLSGAARKLIDQGYRLEYREIAGIDKTYSQAHGRTIPGLADIISDLATNPASIAILAGHGSFKLTAFGGGDPAKSDASGTISILSDFERLKQINVGSIFAPGATLILYSCSTGEAGGAEFADNAGDMWRELVPHAKPKGIMAPRAPTNIEDLSISPASEPIPNVKIKYLNDVQPYLTNKPHKKAIIEEPNVIISPSFNSDLEDEMEQAA